MNDLLNDIEKLQRVTRVLSTVPYSTDIQSVQYYLRNMIKDKQKIVKDFEKQNMPFAEYSEYMKGVGFNA